MKNKNLSTKSLVEAALLSVLIVIATAANLYLPFFEFVGVVVVPLIVSILFIRHDLKVTIMAVICSFICIILIGNVWAAFVFIFLDFLPGVALGYCIKNKKTGIYTLLITAIAYIIGITLAFILANKFIFTVDFNALVEEAVKTYNSKMKTVFEQYKQLGLREDKILELQNRMPKLTKELILYTLPGYMMVTTMIFSFLNYIVATNILDKLNIQVRKIEKFTTWHIDNKIAAITIGLMAIGVIMKSKQIPGGQYIIYTVYIVGGFIFFVAGLSLMVYLLKERYKISKSMLILIIILTFIFNVSSIYFIMGIIDSITNLRKLMGNFQGNK
ncbi:DUF2232 domain-containing protein [Haloimpatiens lingqiaonensis]|uniref:DUF2232 domain-containing protein n=1 Tax=Haloimpatiens lingqiaonensis TaxID=1380675 RepID=UPI0010FE5271|nr:DUF2232 domain-containing protein [Haloimpatiens lingqiaonensis]